MHGKPVQRVNHPPAKPLLLYDAQCPFCRQWVSRWQRRYGESLDYEDYRAASQVFPEISLEQFSNYLHLIEPDGRVFMGAEAVLRSRVYGGRHSGRGLLYLYEKVPGVKFFAEMVYKSVARHRDLVFHLSRWLG